MLVYNLPMTETSGTRPSVEPTIVADVVKNGEPDVEREEEKRTLRAEISDRVGEAAVKHLHDILVDSDNTAGLTIAIGGEFKTITETKRAYADAGGDWYEPEFYKKAGLLELSQERIEYLRNFFNSMKFSNEENDKLDAPESLVNKKPYINNVDQMIRDLTSGDGYASFYDAAGRKCKVRLIATQETDNELQKPKELTPLDRMKGDDSDKEFDGPGRYVAGDGIASYFKYGAFTSNNNTGDNNYLNDFREELDRHLVDAETKHENKFRYWYGGNGELSKKTWAFFGAEHINWDKVSRSLHDAWQSASETDKGYGTNEYGTGDNEYWIPTTRLNAAYILSYLHNGVSLPEPQSSGGDNSGVEAEVTYDNEGFVARVKECINRLAQENYDSSVDIITRLIEYGVVYEDYLGFFTLTDDGNKFLENYLNSVKGQELLEEYPDGSFSLDNFNSIAVKLCEWLKDLYENQAAADAAGKKAAGKYGQQIT